MKYRKTDFLQEEFPPHLGNVLSVITDRKWAVDDGIFNTTTGIKTSSTFDGLADYYVATIVSYSDYDPFGTIQDGRTIPGDGTYRYAFQGQEMDNEIKGRGNSYNYEYRMHDPRLGRFFAVDPLAPKYPHNSPYAFSENRVIDGIELEGLEYFPFHLAQSIIKMGEDLQKAKSSTSTLDGVLWAMKFVNGAAKTATPEGILNSLGEVFSQAYQDGIAVNTGQMTWDEWYKRWGGSPEGKLVEGLLGQIKAAATGDPDAIGQLFGTILMAKAMATTLPEVIIRPKFSLKNFVKATFTERTFFKRRQISKFAKKNNIFSVQRTLAKGQGKAIVDKYYKQMQDGNFDPDLGVGGFYHEGKYYLSEGNHKMNAAIKYAIKTGEGKYVEQLMQKGAWTEGAPANYGEKIYNFPTK